MLIYGKRKMGVFIDDIINSKLSGERVIVVYIFMYVYFRKKLMILFSMYCIVFIFNILLYFFVKVIGVFRRNVKIK